MASSAKPQKEQPRCVPRVPPRPAATASAAPAAARADGDAAAPHAAPARFPRHRIPHVNNPATQRSFQKTGQVRSVERGSESCVMDVPPTLSADAIQATRIDVVEHACRSDQNIQDPVINQQYDTISPPPGSPSSHASSLNEDIQSAFNDKQTQFQRMKRDLDLKQQAILEVFECLRSLNKRALSESIEAGSGEGAQVEQLRIFDVRNWATEEVARLCRDTAVASCASDGTVTKGIDEGTLAELSSKITEVPSSFADVCLQAFTARQELIDWVKELIDKYDGGCGESLDRIARYNSQSFELCETLFVLKSHADDAMGTVTQLSGEACRERGALAAVGASLAREAARLRQHLDVRVVVDNEMRQVCVENESVKSLEETRRELEEERTAQAHMKDKLAAAESELRQTRCRIAKMERQLREADSTVASLTGTVKSIDEQNRQREVQLEARARKLKQCLKIGEVACNEITQQRDALHAKAQSLKEDIDTMTEQHKSSIQELKKEIEELKAVLDEQRQLAQKELEMRKSVETKLTEYHNHVEELKTKNAELEIRRQSPVLPTKREIDLRAELQATKYALHITGYDVATCKQETVRFLETLTKITETEDKVMMQQKLAAELLSQEEVISNMQIQIKELMKKIKFNEQKVVQYEQYVRDPHALCRAVTAHCKDAQNGISYQDLQQEIINLRMGLLDTVHRSEELSEIVAQKEQQLEQKKETSCAQARVLKVREELINLLKNKETQQCRQLAALQEEKQYRMKIVDQVSGKKAEEIQEMLVNRQLRIHHLEKLVLLLEQLYQKTQALRTRHEQQIAELEHTLAARAAAHRRGWKFILF